MQNVIKVTCYSYAIPLDHIYILSLQIWDYWNTGHTLDSFPWLYVNVFGEFQSVCFKKEKLHATSCEDALISTRTDESPVLICDLYLVNNIWSQIQWIRSVSCGLLYKHDVSHVKRRGSEGRLYVLNILFFFWDRKRHSWLAFTECVVQMSFTLGWEQNTVGPRKPPDDVCPIWL